MSTITLLMTSAALAIPAFAVEPVTVTPAGELLKKEKALTEKVEKNDHELIDKSCRASEAKS